MIRAISITFLLGFLLIAKGRAQGGCLAVGGSSYDAGRSIVQTTDGGYAIAGTTCSFGNGSCDVYIVKLDVIGYIQWTRTVGDSSWDEAYSIIQTSDSGYAIVGYTLPSPVSYADIYVVKLDVNGDVVWTKVIGETSTFDVGTSIIQTIDSSYVIAGYTQSGSNNKDILVIKLDMNGNVVWAKTIGGSNDDRVFSIVQTSDGGYALAGWTYSFGAGSSDAYIIKLDSIGNVKWRKVIGGSSSDVASSIIQINDGSYVIAGYTSSFGAGNYDVFVVKLDTVGNVIWARTVGGSNWDEGLSVVQGDGGYIIVGYTRSFGAGLFDVYVVKLDLDGNVQWTRAVGDYGEDYGISVVRTNDGGYALTGESYSFTNGDYDVFVVKLDANGNICSACNTGSGGSLSSPELFIYTPTDSISSSNPPISSNFGMSGVGGIIMPVCAITFVDNSENNFVNKPSVCYSSDKIRIDFGKVYNDVSIIIRDVRGRNLLRKDIRNSDKAELEIKVSSGIYFVELRNKDKKTIFKIIKLRR